MAKPLSVDALHKGEVAQREAASGSIKHLLGNDSKMCIALSANDDEILRVAYSYRILEA